MDIFSKKLLTASPAHKRVYLVESNIPITPTMSRTLGKGVSLFGKMTLPCSIERLDGKQVKMTMIEGKNRQIRRMFRTVGATVTFLKRLSFGPIEIGDLKPGDWQLFDKSLFEKDSSMDLNSF